MPSEPVLHLVTFRRGPLVFGVDVQNVRKVLRAPAIRPLASSPAFVPGGVTVDGRLEVLVDAGRMLSGHDDPPESPRVLLVRHGSRDFGLLADDIDEVVELPSKNAQPPPPFLGGAFAATLRGLVAREKDEVLILDLERVLATEELRSFESAVPFPPGSVSETEDRTEP